MELSDRVRRWTGWLCLAMVATLASMGYYFRNIRFAPWRGVRYPGRRLLD